MFLTTRGRYATRAMIRLALYHGHPPVAVALIARDEGLSEKYLQQLLGTLRRAGLVRVTMGPHGGFELAHDPAQITIGSILRSVEGDISLCECVEHTGVCSRVDDCRARKLWCRATQGLVQFLDSQTLAAVAHGPSAHTARKSKPRSSSASEKSARRLVPVK